MLYSHSWGTLRGTDRDLVSLCPQLPGIAASRGAGKDPLYSQAGGGDHRVAAPGQSMDAGPIRKKDKM